jgi:hypothetical protein
MPIAPAPARILRRIAERCRTRPEPTQRERDRLAYIMEAAQEMFIELGRAAVTVDQFAYSTGMAPVTIRRAVCDMDHVFGLILMKHLDAILIAISAVRYDTPDALARRRAEYFRHTRGYLGIPTPLHFLLLRDRFALPPDELEPVERQHRLIGSLLGGGDTPDDILSQLDCPTLDLAKIESACAGFAAIDRDRQQATQPPPVAEQPEPDYAEPEPERQPGPPAPPDPVAAFQDGALLTRTATRPCGRPFLLRPHPKPAPEDTS